MSEISQTNKDDSFNPSYIIEDQAILVNYWNTLVKRWVIVVSVMILTSLESVWYIKTRPPSPFPYKSVIEIGSSAEGILFESADSIGAKVKGVYLPLALAENAQKNNYDEQRYQVDAKLPEKTSILVLESFGGEEAAADLLTIQQKVVDLLLQDHARIMETSRRALAEENFRATMALERLQEEKKFFPKKYQYLNEKRQLAEKELVETKAMVDLFEKNRSIILSSEAKRGAADESLATALLLIDNDIQKSREKLRLLEGQLAVDLKQQHDNIQKEEQEYKKRLKEQERLIENIQFRIDNFRETRVLIPPSKLLRESGTPPLQILLLATLIGLGLGVFAAFFVEFVIKARHAVQTR